jgi:hypothetical protein
LLTQLLLAVRGRLALSAAPLLRVPVKHPQ